MDIRLPRINGYQATETIKNIKPSVPIIAQTAYAMDIEIQRAEKARCDGSSPSLLIAINSSKRCIPFLDNYL